MGEESLVKQSGYVFLAILIIANILAYLLYSYLDKKHQEEWPLVLKLLVSATPLLLMTFSFDFISYFQFLEKYSPGISVGLFALLIPIMIIIIAIIATTSSTYTTKSGKADKRYKNNPTTGLITSMTFVRISGKIIGINLSALLLYLPVWLLLFK